MKDKKVIDLSVLIESGIDCEFADNPDFHEKSSIDPVFRKLKSFNKWCFVDSRNINWAFCRPRMNHWHHWLGYQCAIPEGFDVDIEYIDVKNGIMQRKSTSEDWINNPTFYSGTIAFKVTGVSEGFCYGWEAK